MPGVGFIRPSGGGGGSVSLAVSDTTPTTGDTITLTATATGFNATNYLFFRYDGVTIEEIVEQSGNTYNWIVDGAGTYDIYVQATDGTVNAYDKASVVATLASILDTYTNATAAYSLRLIRSAYTGDCIRVRRSSDNSEQDIGFVSKVIDTASLLSFVGSGNGFITTWYDQSGNGHDAVQSTLANQPIIVSDGRLLTVNGRPSLSFDGVNDELRATGIGSAGASDYAIFSVSRSYGLSGNSQCVMAFVPNFATNGYSHIVYRNDLTNYLRVMHTSDGHLSDVVTLNPSLTYLVKLTLNSQFASSTTLRYFKNDVLQNSTTIVQATFTNSDQIWIGNYWFTGYNHEGEISELIVYKSDQYPNATAINQDIMNYYAI